ncbi:MAG: hypothetical protein GY855_00870 [candidate division Zixibacteria bacterium]|nr:hypothetical protein [candidate division Zixibacteria bacterium]
MKLRMLKEIIIGIPLGVIIFGVSYYWISNQSSPEVKGVVLKGDEFSLNDSTKIEQFSALDGCFLGIDLSDLGQKACEVFESHSARVQRRPDFKINIHIDMEKPILWVKSNQLYALSGSGRVLDLSKVDRKCDLPVYLMTPGIKLIPGEFCRNTGILYAIEFLNTAMESNSEIAESISTIKIDKDKGVVITLMPSEMPIAFGYSNFEIRILKLKSVLSFINTLENLPSFVNVCYGDIVQIQNYTVKRRGK